MRASTLAAGTLAALLSSALVACSAPPDDLEPLRSAVIGHIEQAASQTPELIEQRVAVFCDDENLDVMDIVVHLGDSDLPEEVDRSGDGAPYPFPGRVKGEPVGTTDDIGTVVTWWTVSDPDAGSSLQAGGTYVGANAPPEMRDGGRCAAPITGRSAVPKN